MFQQLTLGNDRLMDSAHLLQQILFISAVLEAETLGEVALNVKFDACQGSLRRVQEIPISTYLKVFTIKPDIERLQDELQHFRIPIMKNIFAVSILSSNHSSHSLLTSW